jgi:hypothetical protein
VSGPRTTVDAAARAPASMRVQLPADGVSVADRLRYFEGRLPWSLFNCLGNCSMQAQGSLLSHLHAIRARQPTSLVILGISICILSLGS